MPRIFASTSSPVVPPRDRGRLLRTAGERLREAVAEDESFGHAHYNLGVVAAKLAEADIAEQTASPWSQPATRTSADEMSDARWQDARVSFWKATETAPGLWQPDYALAVTIFSQVKPPVRVEESLGTRSHSDNVRRELLNQVVRGCDHALVVLHERGPNTARVCDLRGMAAVRLATADPHDRRYFLAAIRDHRRAATLFLRELRCAKHRARTEPDPTNDARVERARDNATAALHNLALAYARRAMLVCRRKDASCHSTATQGDHASLRACLKYRKADRLFRAALRIGGNLTKRSAASHFERAVALEDRAKHTTAPRAKIRSLRRAADSYERAAAIAPTHAEYTACRARTLAKRAHLLHDAPGAQTLRDEVEADAGRALRELAPTFNCALKPLTARARDEECTETLKALKEAYLALGVDAGERRITDILDLREKLESARSLGEVDAIRTRYACWQRCSRPSEPLTPGWEWELDQIDMCRARLHAAARHWGQEASVFSSSSRISSSVTDSPASGSLISGCERSTRALLDANAQARHVLAGRLAPVARGHWRSRGSTLLTHAIMIASV